MVLEVKFLGRGNRGQKIRPSNSTKTPFPLSNEGLGGALDTRLNETTT